MITRWTTIGNEDVERLTHLLEFLCAEVGSAGGDGDALWYSQFWDVEAILPLVKEVNSKKKFPWEIRVDDHGNGKTINWGTNQEWVSITNDENLYNNAPDWTQCKLQL